MIIVVYWMKDDGKQSRRFQTPAEARAYMLAMAENPDCEAYGPVREREDKTDETADG